MPVDCGSITASSAEAATAASAAVPPARSTSMAVSAASGCEVATMAFWAWTVDRPAKWKLLIAGVALLIVIRRVGCMPEKAGLDDIFGADCAMAAGACRVGDEWEDCGFCGVLPCLLP